MIKIPTLILIFVISFLALYSHQQAFAQNATNTTTAANVTTSGNTTTVEPNTTTTMEATTTTTSTVVAGNVSFMFPSFLYVGQSSSGTISLTRTVADGKDLILTAWLTDNSSLEVSPLQTTFNGSASGTSAWVNLHAVSVPSTNNGYVMWDWSKMGTETGFMLIDGWTSIEIRPLMTVWVSDIPAEITNGTTISFTVTLSGAPPAGYIMVMPSFNGGMNGFFNVSTLTFMKADNTTWTQAVSFTATAPTMNASDFMFTIAGMDSYAYNTTIMGGLPARGTSIVLPMTTTSTTMAPNTTTMAPNTTTMAPNTTTMAPNTTATTASTTSTTLAQTTSSTTNATTTMTTSTAVPTTTMAPTTTTMAPETTTSTTMAPETTSTTPAPTYVTINPSNLPPAWFELTLSSTAPLTTSQRENLIAKLANALGYPASQITLGEQSASGTLLVVLNAPASGAVNQTAVDNAKAVVSTINSNPTLLSYLGAASMATGTTAAPVDDSSSGLSMPALIGIIVGGVVLIAIILFIVKANSSQGTGTAASADNSPSRPLSNMEREMNQHQQQHQHQYRQQPQQQQQGRYIDNEL